MKTITDHLGQILLAVAAVALIVGVVLSFATPIGNVFSSVIGKTQEQAQGDIWNMGTYDVGGSNAGDQEEGKQDGEKSGTAKIVINISGDTLDNLNSMMNARNGCSLTWNGETVSSSGYSVTITVGGSGTLELPSGTAGRVEYRYTLDGDTSLSDGETLTVNYTATATSSPDKGGADPVNITVEWGVSLISFTINGTSYHAEEGMAWYKWCGSEYDTANRWWCDGESGFVHYYSSEYIQYSNGTNVTASDTIAASAYKTGTSTGPDIS